MIAFGAQVCNCPHRVLFGHESYQRQALQKSLQLGVVMTSGGADGGSDGR